MTLQNEPITRVLSYFFALIIGAFSLVFAQDGSARTLITLGQSSQYKVEGRNIEFFRDPTGKMTIQEVLAAGDFKPFHKKEIGFGYTTDRLWVCFDVLNNSDLGDSWLIDFNLNFANGLDIYRLDEAEPPKHHYRYRIDMPFAERDIQSHLLATEFSLKKGEQTRFCLRYWMDGHSGMPLTIETPDNFFAADRDKAAKAFLFTGMMTLLVAVSLITYFVVRSFTVFAYSMYVAATAIFVFHRDGFSFQFLWPDATAFNLYASIPIGACMVIAGTIYARSFLKTPKLHPIYDKFLVVNILMALALVVGSIWFHHGDVKRLMVMCVSYSTLTFFVGGLVASYKRFREVRFFVLGWCGVLVAAVLMSGRHLLGLNITREMTIDSVRYIIIFDGLMMGLAMIDRYLQTRRTQRKTLEENLRIAKQNLDFRGRLDRLEERYAIASNQAEARQRQLSDTSHDLQQPIQSLRLSVHQMAQSETFDPELNNRIHDSFQYLENLISTYLKDENPPELQTEDISDPVHLSGFLENLSNMFEEDAKAKGLKLSVVPTSLQVDAPALDLMRIVANLLSNAIKYNPDGRVLLGCRRSSDRISIEVHDDGPGITKQDMSEASRRSVRLARDANREEGHGLGLAIVHDLCKRHDFKFSWHSVPGRGTMFAVEVPLANTLSR